MDGHSISLALARVAANFQLLLPVAGETDWRATTRVGYSAISFSEEIRFGGLANESQIWFSGLLP